MLLRLLIGCLLAGLSSVSSDAWAAAKDLVAPKWTTHRESSLAVDFPSGLFMAEAGRPPIGQGHRYRTRDGRAVMMIYELENAQSMTPQRYLQNHLAVAPGRLEY